ncbi:hypothetical protein HPB48_016914 [Haemaphysalis longicornis]|uniref:Uncharacterized protein n=1 Tax=Haemaphysalis longicornis TaxID=44386 RepID=A0A9J6G2M8_HAELO|nr:hypothetical protein HPB48_016914 [Haemaphysalis longicornis]
MFSKEDLTTYSSARMNLVAPSKTSFFIRDILGAGSNPAAVGQNSLFDIATTTAAGGAADAAAAGIAALVALRSAGASSWTSSAGAGVEPQAEPQAPACCGGFLLGCVTVPCLGCATSSWNAGREPRALKRSSEGAVHNKTSFAVIK